MRLLAFISYLSILLLNGGAVSHAATNGNPISYIATQNLTQDQGINFSNKDFDNTIVEDNDSDTEDFHDGDLQKDKKNNLILGNGNLTEIKGQSFSILFNLSYYSKSVSSFQSVNTYSLPIYLKNRALRI